MPKRPAERSREFAQDWLPTELFAQENKKFTAPFKAPKKRRFNFSPEARTSEILCTPMEEQNPRLTIGSSPVYHRFITGTRSALSSWLLTSGPTPFCLCKPFSCKACPGISPFTYTGSENIDIVNHEFLFNFWAKNDEIVLNPRLICYFEMYAGTSGFSFFAKHRR